MNFYHTVMYIYCHPYLLYLITTAFEQVDKDGMYMLTKT